MRSCGVTCYLLLEVINFQEIPLRCVSTCFYKATSFAKCTNGGHCASFSFIIFSPSTLVPPLHISLFYSSSLTLPLFHIYLNNFFYRSLTSDVHLTTKECGLCVAVWFLCESRTAGVNRKLLTGLTENVVFTISSNDIFFSLDRRKVSLRKEIRGIEVNFAGRSHVETLKQNESSFRAKSQIVINVIICSSRVNN